ncbi:MAG: hypothetical protein KAJ15_07955 [Spirochaetes bacterium]|nr:hypothetical protein [Spirochaetota bacterium]
MRKDLDNLTKEKLLDYIEILSKNWLAHDGCWFLAIEDDLGLEAAMKYDKTGWVYFTVIEAKRIKKYLALAERPGIEGLTQALKFRLYANINIQEIVEITPNSCIFRMNDCRVQSNRKRKGLDDFPCRTIGEAEYGLFASTIDDRITTSCIHCPPEPHPENSFCAWKFTLNGRDLK